MSEILAHKRRLAARKRPGRRRSMTSLAIDDGHYVVRVKVLGPLALKPSKRRRELDTLQLAIKALGGRLLARNDMVGGLLYSAPDLTLAKTFRKVARRQYRGCLGVDHGWGSDFYFQDLGYCSVE